MSQNLGKVGICPMGDYASGKSYERLSSVFYNHEYWVAVKDVPVGAVPSATSEYWQKMASRGEQGPQGQSYVDKELVPIVDNLTEGGSANVLSAEQGKVLKAELTELESKTIQINRLNADFYNSLTLSIGGIDGGFNLTNDSTRVRTSYISGKFSIEVNEGYKLKYLFKYTLDIEGKITPLVLDTLNSHTYASVDSNGIYRIVLVKDDESAFSNEELSKIIASFIGKKESEEETTEANNLYVWEQGSYNVATQSTYVVSNRIRCWMWANTQVKVKDGCIIKFLFYKGHDGLFTFQNISATSCITNYDGFLVVAKADEAPLAPEDDFINLIESPGKVFKTQLQNFDTYYAPIFNWVQGGIVGDGGEPNVGQEYYYNRLKTTNPILSQGEIITFVVNADYKIRVFRYSSEMTFESYLGEFTNNQTLATISGDNYRFVLLRKDDGNISVEESANCEILGFHADASNGELRYTKPSYNSVSLRNNLKDKRVAFLGDSITQGASASSQAQTYHGVFCQKYGAIDRTAEVYAEKGSESNNLLGMNGTCIAANTKNGLGSTRFVTRATAENFADSKLIVVFGGTNDLSYDRKPIGELFVKETIAASGNMGTQRLTKPTDTETFAGALHELITTIQNVAPKVPIVYMTLMKRDHNSAQNPDYLTCNANGDFMIDYVNAIKEICAFYSIPVLDMYSNSQLNPLAPGWSNLFGDGLHPNNEGHALIGELLFRFVEDNVIVA